MPARLERTKPARDPTRVRYVAFRLDAPRPPTRPGLIAAIRDAARRLGPEAEAADPWLTRFDGRRGILRCAHTGKERAIETLRAVRDVEGTSARIETLGTSGTIAGCVRKFVPDLEDRGEARRASGASGTGRPVR